MARENYEKYGHPDGPQALNLGVALPEWIFSQVKPEGSLMLQNTMQAMLQGKAF